MKNLTKLAIAGVLTASVSTAALAQTSVDVDTNDAEVGAQVDTQVDTTPGAGSATGAGAAAGAQVGGQADAVNYGQVIASLNASGDAESAVEALEDAESARIVTLTELRGSAAEQADALDEAVSRHEDRVEDIRNAIENNDELKEALQARGYEADDVVAAVSDHGGEVTLVVDADA